MGARDAVVAEPALSLLEVLKRSTAWLAERGIDSPRLDAELLLAHALGLRRLDLYLQFARTLTSAERDRVRPLVQERARGVPVAYLTGEREFYSLPFHVDRSVLVPRPETEHLVEAAAARLADRPAAVVADVGTGSGCVIVALLNELSGARGHALDRSPQALAMARKNAERHGLGGRIEFHAGDLLAPLALHADWGRLDAVLSNPPYIVRGDPGLAPDVASHEPAEALYVEGADPLSIAMRLAEEARSGLTPGGFLALEVGAGSAQGAIDRLTQLGYRDARSIPDLAGIPRVVLATR